MNRSVLKVSELNSEVASLLRSGFPLLWIEGEISNLSHPASGHLYFSLKDSKAQVRCAMFKNKSMLLSIAPKNGLKVIARATVGLYEARGEFQLIIEHMEDAGIGQLKQAFDQLKNKLSNTGLFDIKYKQPLPKYPQKIGLISSPTGAALHDVINVLARRCPHIPLLIYPSLVQGESASKELITAINQANHDKQCDILLLVRGGGSIEDLWAFNNEDLAHVIFNSTIPIITGVGHEVDFTIADFVSDQRAPTPSAAAELASTNQSEQKEIINKLQRQLYQLINNKHQQYTTKLSYLHKRLQQRSKLSLIPQYIQSIDYLEIRLARCLSQLIENKKYQTQQIEQQLLNLSPIKATQEQGIKLNNLTVRLQNTIQLTFKTAQTRLNTTTQILDAISPLATMKRGYSISRDYKGVIINSVQQVRKGQKLNFLMSDGELICTIDERIVQKK